MHGILRIKKRNRRRILFIHVAETGSLRDAALIAEKEKIAANGEYNLSGEQYREGQQA